MAEGERNPAQERGIRRTVLLTVLLAAGFYLGFIGWTWMH